MTIECPAASCEHRYEDRDRASLIQALGADTAAVEINRRQGSTTACPRCGQTIQFGLLMLDDDGVWRVSSFAGQAEDVTVMRPPGGKVSYEAPERQATEDAIELSAGELKIRQRALAAIAGSSAGVAPAVQRDVVELALEAGVLHDAELPDARAWLERRPL